MNNPPSFQNSKSRSSFQIMTNKYQPYQQAPHHFPKKQQTSQQNSFGFKKTEIEKPLINLNPKMTQSGGKKSYKPMNLYNGISPINSPTGNRSIPSFLEGKVPMKASLMSDEFIKNSHHAIIQSPKRSPRISEHHHIHDVKKSKIQFNQIKMPTFLNKNEGQKEMMYKKKFQKQQQKKDSHEKQLNRVTSSGSTFHTQNNDKVKMKMSSFDPTADWVKQSWGKKKGKKLTISDFLQIKQLGTGKYGHVYLAKQKKTNFICALKIIQKKLLRQQQITQQFIRQLKIQMYLNHPNIIKMYGFFDDQINIYIILQVGTGGQLFKYLKHSRNMPQQKVAAFMTQICQAINQIHSSQIIHRDLKPQNIVLHDNIVKLCDFGWSVHMDKTLRTTFCGTPLYVCPQILRGKDYDQKIDIWSLGVIMYQMVVGQNPFKITKQEQLIKIVKDAVIIPPYVQVSKEAKDFLDCCLQKNPQQRSNIRELLNHSFFKRYPDKNDKRMKV